VFVLFYGTIGAPPKRRWIESIEGDLREKNLNPEMANNRNTWRRLIHNGDPE